MPELASGLYGLAERTTTEEALARLTRAVSPLYGIVHEVSQSLRFPDEIALPNFHAATNSYFRLAPDGRTRLVRKAEADTAVGGSGLYDRATAAMAAALGEALERYSAAFIPDDDALAFGSYQEFEDHAIPATSFRFFTDDQLARDGFPYSRFDPSARMRWCQGLRLPDLAPILAPAQLIYFGNRAFASMSPREPLLAPITSNGLASGVTATEAALSAIFELLERDAAMITWYNRLAMPRLVWEGESLFDDYERERLAMCPAEAVALDLSVFHGIPIVLAISRGTVGQWKTLTMGGSAGSTVFTAWQKALSEALGLRTWLRDVNEEAINSVRLLQPEEVRSFHDHVAYYCHEENLRHTEFLDSSPQTRSVRDIPALPVLPPGELLEWLTASLQSRGIDVYLFDVTSPDVADLGLSVVRAFAPALCPLHTAETYRFAGVPRLRSAPAALGLETPTELNPYPHPFP